MFRMMCVTAHPDDEAGNFGGTLRLYHDRGVQTAVLCLTPGQAAGHRGNATNDAELAALRRKEFQASCEILGVSRAVVLDYADGQLHRLDAYSVVCEITRHIREFRPQIVLTYGSDGGFTAHTDHALAGMFASLAAQWSGHPNRYPDHFNAGLKPHRVQRLYHCTADFVLSGRPPINAAPISTAMDISSYLETKIQAFHAHTTQSPLFDLFDNHIRPHVHKEMYHLAASSTLGPIREEADLFAAVIDED